MERMIEVCAGSYQDCIAAYQGSAKRVELNSSCKTRNRLNSYLHGTCACCWFLL